MATSKNKEASKEEVLPKKAVKQIPMKEHLLIKDAPIGDKVIKKGKSVKLTEKGRIHFKSLNYIK